MNIGFFNYCILFFIIKYWENNNGFFLKKFIFELIHICMDCYAFIYYTCDFFNIEIIYKQKKYLFSLFLISHN